MCFFPYFNELFDMRIFLVVIFILLFLACLKTIHTCWLLVHLLKFNIVRLLEWCCINSQEMCVLLSSKMKAIHSCRPLIVSRNLCLNNCNDMAKKYFKLRHSKYVTYECLLVKAVAFVCQYKVQNQHDTL